MSGDRVRVGVVGTGWWATQVHLAALLANPNVTVTALADTDPQRLERAAVHFGINERFVDPDAMFASGLLDGVVIATPHATHYALVKAALEHDLHVLCEKPFVLEASQGHELLGIARERRRHMLVGFTYQYTRHARLARQMIHSGKIGELLFVSGLFASMVEAYYRGNVSEYESVFNFPVVAPDRQTYSDPRLSGGGQAQTQVSHAMNMVFWVTGRRATEVHGWMLNRGLPVDLADAIAYRFDNGALGTMASTGSLRPGQPQQQEFRYYGTRGFLLQELIQGKLTVCMNDGTTESVPDLTAAETYPGEAVTAGWVDVIRGCGENLSDAETAVRTVEFIEAAYRSAARGSPVRIAPPSA
ncbi:MAG: Gfo/Idh/MocA family oxidoreductase [Proteobacteria bacterium]|nr:Gfo/Idh/MocA family oxidoreductase [Pseudomonadota bacterium]